jgi:2-keto-3-deoxy-L-rhamnonate aldolase RhmA
MEARCMSDTPITSHRSAATFRQRLLGAEMLIGTFIKTPHAAVVEVLGHTSLDCVCLDAEHAPFDRAALDATLLAARAADLPALVRIQRADSADILNALDLGACGVLIPHVTSAESVRTLALSARYRPEGRGYSGSTRAAGHTTRKMSEIITDANSTVVVIGQIEDAAALNHLDAIAAIDSLDCLFIGRMDLTVSLGAQSPEDAKVVDAVRTICAAAARHSRRVGMFTSTVEEARQWAAAGVSLFLLESDQQWLLQGARGLVAGLRGI